MSEETKPAAPDDLVEKVCGQCGGDGVDGISYTGVFACPHCDETGTVKQTLTVEDADVAFLRECAATFRDMPDNGEDRTYWAKISNAENCQRIAARIQSDAAELAFHRAEAEENARIIGMSAERELALRAEVARLRKAVSVLLPRGLCWENPHIQDDAVIPVDMTMGEIRKALKALNP